MATKLLSLAQAAQLLGVSADVVRKAATRGTLQVEWIGRQRVVTPEEVERYRAEHLGRRGRPRKDADA